MAVFKNSESNEKINEAELLVQKALKQLDDNWFIFQNFRFKASFEIDFLLFNENYGFLIIEVKGGNIEKKGLTWYQNDRIMKLSPDAQVKKNQVEFRDFIREKFPQKTITTKNGRVFPDVEVNFCLFFPACEFPKEDLQYKDNKKAFIYDKYDLRYIKEAVENRFNGHKNTFTVNDLDYLIESIIDKNFQFRKNLKNTLKELNDITDCYKKTFLDLYNFVKNVDDRKVIIRSVFGAGDIACGCALASRIAKDGESVLCLCNSQSLYLRLTKLEFFNQRNISVKTKKDLFANESTYDFILIFEGEHFVNEWHAIERFTEFQKIYIFVDYTTNKLGLTEEYRALQKFFEYNCRNTRSIVEFLSKGMIHPYRINNNPEKPKGDAPIVYVESNLFNATERVFCILKELVCERKIGVDKIIVVGDNSIGDIFSSNSNYNFSSETTIVKRDKINISEKDSEDCVLYRKYTNFIGCESPILLFLYSGSMNIANNDYLKIISSANILLYLIQY